MNVSNRIAEAVGAVTEPLARLGVRGLVAKYGWALLAPAVTLSAALLLNAVASRTLGAGGFGVFSVGVATLTLLGMAMGAGLPTTLVRFGSLALAPDAYRRIAWRLAGLCILAGVSLVAAFSWLLPSVATRWIPVHTEPWIVLGGIAVVMMELSAAEAQLSHRYDRYFWIMVGNSLLRVIGVVAGVLLGTGSHVDALKGYAIASLTGAAVLSISGVRASVTRATVTLTADVVRMARFALPVAASTLVVAAIMNADTLLLTLVLPADAVGLYAAGSRLTALQTTLITGLTVVALPTASRALLQGRIAQFAGRAVSFGAILGVLVTVVAILSSSWLVRVVYGAEYGASAPVFAILSLSLLPNFIGNLVVQVLYAAGAPHLILLVHSALLLALLVGMPAAASEWGIVGAAWFRAAVNLVAVAVIIYLSLTAAVRTDHPKQPATMP